MFETMILGAGPGGTGALAWAAANGCLGAWLDRGVAVVDQRSVMGGTVGRYAINGDTLGGTFLECLDGPAPDPCLGPLRDDPATRALEAYRTSLPPLALVGRFLRRLGAALAGEMARHARSRFFSGMHVTALRLGRDGSVVADLTDRCGRTQALRAGSAVLALGGHQIVAMRTMTLRPGICLDNWREKMLPSDLLLAFGGTGLAALRLSRHRPPRAVVLGGSHSGLSSAWMLLERMRGMSFRPGGLYLLYRSTPRVFYASRADAAADGYVFAETDVCPATGRVHRLGGLRGDGRELWRRLQGLGGLAAEDRAVALPLDAMDATTLRDLLDAADLIVPAFGYRLTTVPVYAADGQAISLAGNGPVVDGDARLCTAGGGALSNVFGIGLGSGFRPWGAMGGEPGFHGQQNSLWLYQHGLGAMIYDGVRHWAAQRQVRGSGSGLRWALDLATLTRPPDAPVPGVT